MGKPQLAESLNVSASKIKDLTVSEGSIKVDFTVEEDPSTSSSGVSAAANLENKINTMKSQAQSGTLKYTIDGTELAADGSSFQFSAVTQPPVQTTAAVAATKSPMLSGGAIAGIVIGALIFIIVIIILIYMLIQYKSQGKVSPDEEAGQSNRGSPEQDNVGYVGDDEEDGPK